MLDNPPLNAVFMGTPEIASHSLSAMKVLSETGIINLKCVYTKPPAWNNKKKELSYSPVYREAGNQYGGNIKISTPKSLKNNEEELNYLKSLDLDLIIVVAFGQILPSDILSIPKFGVINLHPSLLPELRGPSPIHYAVLKKLKYSGISIMALDEGVDSGPVIAQKMEKIGRDEFFGNIYSRFSESGALLISEVVKTIYKFRVHAYKLGCGQEKLDGLTETNGSNCGSLNMSYMISREDRFVDFKNDEPVGIYSKIKAFGEIGGALVKFRDKLFGIINADIIVDKDGLREEPHGKIFDPAENINEKCYNYKDYIYPPFPGVFQYFTGEIGKQSGSLDFKPGTVVLSGKKGLVLSTNIKGVYLNVLELKPEGKNKMPFSDFINGYRIKQGDLIE